MGGGGGVGRRPDFTRTQPEAVCARSEAQLRPSHAALQRGNGKHSDLRSREIRRCSDWGQLSIDKRPHFRLKSFVGFCIER